MARRPGRTVLSQRKETTRRENQQRASVRQARAHQLLTDIPADSVPSPKRPHTERADLDTVYLPDPHTGWL